jgi:hypothetical protein
VVRGSDSTASVVAVIASRASQQCKRHRGRSNCSQRLSTSTIRTVPHAGWKCAAPHPWPHNRPREREEERGGKAFRRGLPFQGRTAARATGAEGHRAASVVGHGGRGSTILAPPFQRPWRG